MRHRARPDMPPANSRFVHMSGKLENGPARMPGGRPPGSGKKAKRLEQTAAASAARWKHKAGVDLNTPSQLRWRSQPGPSLVGAASDSVRGRPTFRARATAAPAAKGRSRALHATPRLTLFLSVTSITTLLTKLAQISVSTSPQRLVYRAYTM